LRLKFRETAESLDDFVGLAVIYYSEHAANADRVKKSFRALADKPVSCAAYWPVFTRSNEGFQCNRGLLWSCCVEEIFVAAEVI